MRQPNASGLHNPAYWDALSDADLADSIRDAEAMVAEHRTNLDDAQRFLDALRVIRCRRDGRCKVCSK